MKLFHTSSSLITEISPCSDYFGECLFFSATEYKMSEASIYTYAIEVDESEIIEANSFFFQNDCEKLNDLVAEVMDLADCGEEQAQELLSQNDSHEDAEIDWEIQGLTGMAAKALGYKCAEAQDEQGCVYIVPMFSKEEWLNLQ